MSYDHKLGWIGTGRMGYALARRLLEAGCNLSVYNRTRRKAEPLSDLGARIVDSPADLADRDIVFTMVAGPKDVLDVTVGKQGVLASDTVAPKILIDSTTIDPLTSENLRRAAKARDTDMLAVPVSGNPKVVKSGKLTSVVSGPRRAYEQALPYLQIYGRKVTYVGENDEARLVKICHNLLLGVTTEILAEITILAEKAGVSRSDFLIFLNESVLGSTFTRYKTPAFVNLDFEPTFTWHLLRKDLELGLDQGRALDVPLPTAALVHQIVLDGIGRGLGDLDFAALLELAATRSGMSIQSEDSAVDDGLSPPLPD